MKSLLFAKRCVIASLVLVFCQVASAQPHPSPLGALLAQDDGTDWPLTYGKYSCIASSYERGEWIYIPRGTFIIRPDGTYSYLGFKEPSPGTFTIDAASNLHFRGGHLDGGEATKIDRRDKFFLVFPTIQDNRWTATLITP